MNHGFHWSGNEGAILHEAGQHLRQEPLGVCPVHLLPLAPPQHRRCVNEHDLPGLGIAVGGKERLAACDELLPRIRARPGRCLNPVGDLLLHLLNDGPK